jgi:pimeloyl-ACP methyl ester carboxylesterase
MPILQINGASLHVGVFGKGTPIIFIHPPVLSSVNFEHQVKELSNYFRIITFDLRGHGQSPPTKQPLTYSLIAEDIKGIMDHLEIEKAFLCGYSTGGGIILEFLLNYPERAQGGIVISGMSEVSDWKLKQKINLGIKLSSAGAIKLIAASVAWGNANTKELRYKMYRDARKTDAKHAEDYYRSSLNYDCTEQLWKITAPILLVYGQKDPGFHRYGQMLQKRLPYSELVYVKNVRHQIPTKSAIELNDLIKRFIFTHPSIQPKETESEKASYVPMESVITPETDHAQW